MNKEEPTVEAEVMGFVRVDSYFSYMLLIAESGKPSQAGNFKNLEGAGVHQGVPSTSQNGKLSMGLDSIHTKKQIPKGGT